jgi:hypothetical protein
MLRWSATPSIMHHSAILLMFLAGCDGSAAAELAAADLRAPFDLTDPAAPDLAGPCADPAAVKAASARAHCRIRMAYTPLSPTATAAARRRRAPRRRSGRGTHRGRRRRLHGGRARRRRVAVPARRVGRERPVGDALVSDGAAACLRRRQSRRAPVRSLARRSRPRHPRLQRPRQSRRCVGLLRRHQQPGPGQPRASPPRCHRRLAVAVPASPARPWGPSALNMR